MSKVKQKEKKRDSILDGVPKALPALTKAKRIQEKAAIVDFDWTNIAQVYYKIDEELIELKEAIKSKKYNDIEEELGDVLFTIVNLSRNKYINDAKFKICKKPIVKFKNTWICF